MNKIKKARKKAKSFRTKFCCYHVVLYIIVSETFSSVENRALYTEHLKCPLSSQHTTVSIARFQFFPNHHIESDWAVVNERGIQTLNAAWKKKFTVEEKTRKKNDLQITFKKNTSIQLGIKIFFFIFTYFFRTALFTTDHSHSLTHYAARTFYNWCATLCVDLLFSLFLLVIQISSEPSRKNEVSCE